MARILILDGHCSAALAFVRSLGRAGHLVAVGFSQGTFAPAALSRYCQMSFDYPNPTNGVTRFSEQIQRLVLEQGIDLVVPMTDVTTQPLSHLCEQFHGKTRLAVPLPDMLATVNDKYQTIILAQKLGISVPKTKFISSKEDLQTIADWGFPLVVKDRFSIRWINGQGISGSTIYCYSEKDLISTVEQRLEQVGDVLVQQFFGGVGIGFSCFISKGEMYLPFQWRRLREKDPRGSGSSARMSSTVQPRVLEYGEQLLSAVDFNGIAMVEFKQDLRTGHLSFMEINGRPWGSMQLPIHCGIDYPRHLAEFHLEGRLPPKYINYRRRITCRWLVADLLHLENIWEGKPAGWPTAYPNFLVSFLKVIIPWHPGLHYDHLTLHDPRPGVADLTMWLRSRFGKRH